MDPVENMPKKILIIAYFFPPLGGSGVQRTLKFVKYLPLFGLQPLVSTVRQGHNFAYDESLLQEVPESAKVFRSNSMETLWLRNLIERFAQRKTVSVQTPEAVTAAAFASAPASSSAPASASAPAVPAAQAVPARKSLKQRLFDFVDDYLFIPDSKVRWFPSGVLASLKAARQEGAEVIFSSSYPYTVHLIALWVQKFYHRPWIADFRDPWVGNEAMAKDIPLRRKADAWLERKVVQHASYVINVTSSITDMYKARYPEYAEKFVTITNGFDPQDFVKVVPHAFAKFTLIHTGILSKKRSPEALVRGLEKLLAERPELKDKLQVVFVGYLPDEFKQMFQDSMVSEIFQVWPYVPHSVCLDYLAGAQLQLLIFDDSPETKAAYSGKIFDYIGTQKPILGIVPEGVAADLIRKKGIGTVVAIGDAEGVKAAIVKHYDEWAAGAGSIDSAARCAEFSRVNLAGQLAHLIAEVRS